MSVVTLIIQTAVLTEYWSSKFGVGWATLVLLSCILILNCFGVKVRVDPHLTENVSKLMLSALRHFGTHIQMVQDTNHNRVNYPYDCHKGRW
jgi:hypothetical protein